MIEILQEIQKKNEFEEKMMTNKNPTDINNERE